MSTPIFLTWSLLTSGVFALLGLFVRRRAVAKHGTLPPLTGVQSAIMAAMIFLLGAQVTAFGSRTLTDTPSSSLTTPLSGALVALVGLNGLYGMRKDGETFRWQRRLSWFNLVAGASMLVLGILWP